MNTSDTESARTAAKRKIAEIICNRIAEGETLEHICSARHMPAVRTFCDWRMRDPEIHHLYVTAWAARAERLAHEILQIIDEPVLTYQRDGETRIDPASVADKRLRAEGRKWVFIALRLERCPELHSTDPTNPEVGTRVPARPHSPPPPPATEPWPDPADLLESVKHMSPTLVVTEAERAGGSVYIEDATYAQAPLDAEGYPILPPLDESASPLERARYGSISLTCTLAKYSGVPITIGAPGSTSNPPPADAPGGGGGFPA